MSPERELHDLAIMMRVFPFWSASLISIPSHTEAFDASAMIISDSFTVWNAFLYLPSFVQEKAFVFLGVFTISKRGLISVSRNV